MCLLARAADAVLDHPAEIVRLVRVDEGVVHAHVGQAAAEQQRIGLQAAQQNLEVRAEEGRVPPLPDDVVVGAKARLLGGDCRVRVVFETVDVLVTVQLASEIDVVRPVDLLNEDDRDAPFARLVDQTARLEHAFGVARHDGDRPVPERFVEGESLDVDDDESGVAFD